MNERKLDALFDNGTDGNAYLLKVIPKEFMRSLRAVFEASVDHDMAVVLVGVKLPYVNIHKLLQDHRIPEDNIYMVDAITRTVTDEGVIERDNVRYLEGPQNLSNVGTSISLMVEKSNTEHVIVIVDSLETMLTYNQPRAVANLLDDLKDRTRTLDLRLSLFKQSQELEEQIGSELYAIIDEIVFISNDPSETVKVINEGTYSKIQLPRDIVRSLGWKNDEELDYNVKRDKSITLRRKDD